MIGATGLIVACGSREAPSEEPVTTVLLLFDVSRIDQPDELQLERLFEMEDDERFRAVLLDAIDRLPEGEPDVRHVERFGDLGRAVVDVTFGMSADSEADYSVQVEQTGETDWRVSGFHGPGVSWPPRQRPRGPGLSTRPDR